MSPGRVLVLAVAVTAVAGSVAIFRATEPSEVRLAIPDDAPVALGPTDRSNTSRSITSSDAASDDPSDPPSDNEPPATSSSLAEAVPARTRVEVTMSELSAAPAIAAETDSGSVLTAIVHVRDSGLLATGNTEDGAAIVLASVDGRRWTRLPEVEVELGKARVLNMVVAGGRLIAVGSRDGLLSAWESEDGHGWERIDVAHGHQGVGFLADVAVDGGRVVAVGFEVGGASAWVLTSDGFQPAETVDAEDGSLVLDGLTAIEGIFLAGGNDDTGATMWRSVDGLRWERTDLAGPTARAVVKDVESVGRRVVAVGYDHQGPRAWASDHRGESWSVVDGPELSDARPQLLTSAVGLDDTVLALGQGDGSPLCWLLAPRADSWTSCSSVGEAELALVTAAEAFDTGFAVAVGRSIRADDDGMAIWLLETQLPPERVKET